jgi:Fe-S-cluster containining protein
MLELSLESQREFRRAVEAAAARAEVRAVVGEIYAKLEREIEARKPRCEMSGRCCRFEQYGHRLFVTTMELGEFVGSLDLTKRATQASPLQGCPFQLGKICSVHQIRPFGCRIFFCDPTAQDWQNEHYEWFHAELKRAHERLGIPYFYVEWRHALRAVGLIDVPGVL